MDNSGPIEVWTEGEKFNPPVNKEPMTRKKGDALCSSPRVFFKYPGEIVVELAEKCEVRGKRVSAPHGGAIFFGEKAIATIDRALFKTDPPEIARERSEPRMPAGRKAKCCTCKTGWTASRAGRNR